MPEEIVQQCAAQVLDTMHLIVKSVGPDIKKHAAEDLSMSQFRTLMTIKQNDGCSLSDVSDNMGTTISAASKTVDSLVERSMVTRNTASDDRRKIILRMTSDGKTALDSVDLDLLKCMADKLSGLSENECAMINLAMNLLKSAVTKADKTKI